MYLNGCINLILLCDSILLASTSFSTTVPTSPYQTQVTLASSKSSVVTPVRPSITFSISQLTHFAALITQFHV